MPVCSPGQGRLSGMGAAPSRELPSARARPRPRVAGTGANPVTAQASAAPGYGAGGHDLSLPQAARAHSGMGPTDERPARGWQEASNGLPTTGPRPAYGSLRPR